MKFDPPLKPARLIKRYKRFLADVALQDIDQQAPTSPDQQPVTLHVANTGAMTGCAEPGDTIYYSTSDNPKRKYPFSWELTLTSDNHFICVNTIRANQLVEEAINNQVITQLRGYGLLQREVKYGDENSKIDFLLSGHPELADAYVEVKSVTLLEKNQGYFPDAVSKRGQKHLRELINVVESGQRAVLLFAVLHSGINSVKPALHIDKQYAQLLLDAEQAGVEVLAYQASITPKGMQLETPLPFSQAI